MNRRRQIAQRLRWVAPAGAGLMAALVVAALLLSVLAYDVHITNHG